MINKIIYTLFFFSCVFVQAQTFKGKVLDAQTKEPLETVSVYFDNTTIGTTTNELGEFSIDYNDAVQSTLVISFLGYEKVFISDYRNKSEVTVELKESINELDEVIIDTDDGMSRERKLRWFRNEFLGRSENAKSCKILNEKDIKLRYNKRQRVITAWSNKPVIVRNKSLQYEVSFDIIDFEIVLGNFNPKSVTYLGTSFYKDLDTKKKNKILKARAKTYKGSIQHFMRALYNKQLEEEGYIFGKEGFKVKPYDHFIIKDNAEGLDLKTISLKDNRLDIFYNDVVESIIEVSTTEFIVDKYGNYEPIPNVLFGGNMGKQRIADSLPLDYQLTN